MMNMGSTTHSGFGGGQASKKVWIRFQEQVLEGLAGCGKFFRKVFNRPLSQFGYMP